MFSMKVHVDMEASYFILIALACLLQPSVQSFEDIEGTTKGGVTAEQFNHFASPRNLTTEVDMLHRRLMKLESDVGIRFTKLEETGRRRQSLVDGMQRGSEQMEATITKLDSELSSLNSTVQRSSAVEQSLQSKMKKMEDKEQSLHSRMNDMEERFNNGHGSTNKQWEVQQLNVCYGAKNNPKGGFTIKQAGLLIAIRLVHRSGYLDCPPMYEASRWGCDWPKGEDALYTIVTDHRKKILFPEAAKVSKIKGQYQLSGFHTRSDELVFVNTKNPVYVVRGSDMQVWYGQDLVGFSGRHCVDVYARFKDILD